jgi:acyl dehydratase
MSAPPAVRKFPPITRQDVEAICRATNDASPLHLDEEYAKRAGHPTIVVPAMIVLGWVGEFIADWVGLRFRSLRWGIRLCGPVWPGDRLIIEAQHTEESEPRGRSGRIEVRTDSGRVVGKAFFEVGDG